MSVRLHVRENLRSELAADYHRFAAAEGETLARSVTSSTTRIELFGRTMFRKRYVYPPITSLKAALRNTLVRPSRAEREFRMLALFGERMGNEAVPEPIAFGEKRTCLFLREALLITLAVPGGVTLQTTGIPNPAAARALGIFVARLHRAGLTHGSLFSRNLIQAPDGSIRVVDLDHARACAPGRLASLSARSQDLAFLDESIRGSRQDRLRALQSYAQEVGEESLAIAAVVTNYREEARARLDRRKRERPPGRRPA